MSDNDRYWAPPKVARSLLALAVWALLLPSAALAQADVASLFATDARAPGGVPVGETAAGTATNEPVRIGRSRIARADLARLGALRESVASGRPEKLRLNLLHGVEHLATVERSVPTASGYTLSGPLDDVPFGRAVLVVNGGTVMGRVYTPQGAWSIRTAGAVQVVEPMQAQPLRCATAPPANDQADSMGVSRPTAMFQPVRSAEAAGTGRGAQPGADPAGSEHGMPARASAKSSAADDGVVDVLVAYPSFARELEGGYATMLALIDLDIATANEAYAASGVDLRVELAAAVEVEYDRFMETFRLTQTGDRSEFSLVPWWEVIDHLSGRDDGHMDEVHALRDRHAADFVLLHLGGRAQQAIGEHYVQGIAHGVPSASKESMEALGFSVALSGDGTVVAHELGHSMGLRHDRHEDTRNEPFPYSHGFRYQAPNSGHVHGTMMSQYSSRGFGEEFVLAFSNPDLSHPLHPDLKLGVPGDAPSSEVDGPADAARHLNELRGVIANVRARADADPCRYALSGDGGELPPEGGAYRLRVEAGPDCAWTASGGEWVSSVSPASGKGSGEVEVVVGGNAHWGRPVEVLVAGRLHKRHQAGSRPITPLCERTIWPSIANQLERLHPEHDYSQWSCEVYERRLFNEESLAAIRTLRSPFYDYREDFSLDWSRKWGFGPDDRGLRHGDFDGLTGLVELKIHSVDRLPSELFSGLTGLRSLEITIGIGQEPTLVGIAPRAFHGLPGLRILRIDGHRIGAFRAGNFEGMPGLIHLWVNSVGGFSAEGVRPQVTRFEPGAFSGLDSLRVLVIYRHEAGRLDAGVVSGLPRLQVLFLTENELRSVAPGALEGLAELRRVDLSFNRLDTLPAGLFADLSKLTQIDLWNNRLTRLPAGLFEGLGELEDLSLWTNRLTALEPGTFSGLHSLEKLNVQNNRLRNLPPGLFADLGSLEELYLRWNGLGALRAGTFDGLDSLLRLYLVGAGITSLEPGALDGMPSLRVLDLERNGLWRIPPSTFTGQELRGLHLEGNPGAPFAFAPTPALLPEQAPSEAGRPVAVGLRLSPEAPFLVQGQLSASGGSLSAVGGWSPEWQHLEPGWAHSGGAAVSPDGDGPVTVRVGGIQWPGKAGDVDQGGPVINVGDLQFTIDYRYGYSGFRVEPGPPLVLYGIEDRSLTLGRGPESIDLAGVFSYFLGFAEYAAESSHGAVAEVSVEDGELTVTPGAAGSAEVTVTAKSPDGETMTRRFSVTVRAPSVPLFLSGSNSGRVGFVRLVNRSGRAGDVRITAIDDAGARRGPVSLRLRANGAAHFNSGDLEEGNEAKGLPEGVGMGEGDWRLEFDTDLDIEALAYVRTADGFVTAMHGAAPAEGDVRRIATFNPASNDLQASRLRVVNPGREAAAVTVRGVDDAGASPGGPVRFTVPAGGAREFGAAQLEFGDVDLEGALGDGEGKWRLEVESGAPIVAMSLLESVMTGHLSNLSSGPRPPDAGGRHHVPLLPAASDQEANGREGFVRVLNRSGRAGTVRIEAFDDAGTAYEPLELSLAAGAAAHFNSSDLEFGNAAKGLSGSAGAGEGGWRLELASDLDIGVLAYVRSEDGFLTAIHDVAAFEGGRHWAPFFNPGSNHRQLSRLRLVNPTRRAVEVSVVGADDYGGAPPNRGAAWITVPAGAALTLDAAELEAGLVSGGYMRALESGENPWIDETYSGYWARHPLGDGSGKWRLSVSAEQGVLVQSLLESPTGHLTNLSSGRR
ncbi:MAG: leucine-rich repeat protein [Gammaproteobacteria bacterium]|nr:leucine-rich repeat protein [Gammaproteobacteria bacterium]MYK81260.1 leucine-rich repeat protein [Gammaproteobacteria bacterium]